MSTSTHAGHGARNLSRQRGRFTDAFDRIMDQRERLSRRIAMTNCAFHASMSMDMAEIERRSFLDVLAPSRS